MQNLSDSRASAYLTPQQQCLTQALGTRRCKQLLTEILRGTTRGFLNANDSVIQDRMTTECGYHAFYTLVVPEDFEGGAGVGQRWEGQGRGWPLSQLKRGSYHFLPRQG